MKLIITFFLGILTICQTNFAFAYPGYASSQTDPGVTCSSCHNDGRQWVPPVSSIPVPTVPTPTVSVPSTTTPNISAISAPTLSVLTLGVEITLSWSSVPGAVDYTLYYAPYPYSGEDSINSISMGATQSFSATLTDGTAYYVAITANNGTSESSYSNVELITINSGTSTGIDPELELSTTCLNCHGDKSNEVECGDTDWLAHQGARVSDSIFLAVNNYLNGSCAAKNNDEDEESNREDEENNREDD